MNDVLLRCNPTSCALVEIASIMNMRGICKGMQFFNIHTGELSHPNILSRAL